MMTRRRTITLCVLVVSLGPVSLGLATPVMPALVEGFAAGEAPVKLTVSVYLAGFAISQMLCGALSDAWGRKPVALGFIGLYVAATIAATLSPGLEWFAVARFFQGAGSAVGWVISRAVVRDLHVGKVAGNILAWISGTIGAVPALAPLIGGITIDHFGWRVVFLVMTVFGIGVWCAIALLLEETNRTKDPAAVFPSKLFRISAGLIRDLRFLGPALALGSGIGLNYGLQTIMPFILIDRVGLSPTQFGLAMIISATSYVLGAVIAGNLFRRIRGGHLILLGLVTQLLAGLALILVTTFAGLSLVSVMAPLFVFGLGSAIVMPAASAEAIAPFGEVAGSASALISFCQVGTGLLVSLLVALIGDPVAALLIMSPTLPLLGLVAYLTTARRMPP